MDETAKSAIFCKFMMVTYLLSYDGMLSQIYDFFLTNLWFL